MTDKFFHWQEQNLPLLGKLNAEENRRTTWYASASLMRHECDKRLAKLKLMLLQGDTDKALRSLDDIDAGLLFDDK